MDFFSWMAERGVDQVRYRKGIWIPPGISECDAFDEIDRLIRRLEHEELHLFWDRSSGGRFAVSIHSTVRGPALGGFRLWRYPSAAAALTDAVRLARGMTLKNAAIGLELGGRKTVGWLDERGKSPELIRAFARFLLRLEGRYITAEDVGTTVADMDQIDREVEGKTKRVLVVCCSASRGGSGNPSPFTAAGIHRAMELSCETALGRSDLRGLRVAIQGLGNVGSALARRLIRDGASLIVSDLDPQRVAATCREAQQGGVPCAAAGEEEIYGVDCDVFSPCALGGVLDDRTIPQLRCRVVAGSANNQLADEDRHADLLQRRGILYAPDFVINAGGVVNAAMEFFDKVHDLPYREEAVVARIEEIFTNLKTIFARAEREGVTPYRAALEIARERIRRKADPAR